PEVRQTRSDILERTALAFRPDLLFVDKRAAGVDGELMATLRTIRRCALPTKIVVGIRDIIDEPEATRRSLRRARDLATIARYYDEVWLYGARSVCDAATARWPTSRSSMSSQTSRNATPRRTSWCRWRGTTPCASSCRAASAPYSCRAASRCASNCCGPASSRRAACSTWSSRTRSCRT